MAKGKHSVETSNNPVKIIIVLALLAFILASLLICMHLLRQKRDLQMEQVGTLNLSEELRPQENGGFAIDGNHVIPSLGDDGTAQTVGGETEVIQVGMSIDIGTPSEQTADLIPASATDFGDSIEASASDP